MIKPTLSGKISLLVTFFIIISLSIGTILFLQRLNDITDENIKGKVNVINNTLMPSLADSILKSELSKIQTIIELLVQSDKDIMLIVVKDDSGKDLAQARGLNGKVYKKFSSLVTVPGTGLDLGYVDIIYNLDSFLKQRNEIRNNMIKIAIIIVLISIIVSAFLSKKLTVQLERLRDASIKISQGDLTQKVIPKTKDEIGTLGKIFNDMVDKIKKSQEKLKKSNDELSAIYEVGRIINSCDNLDEVFHLSTETLQTGFGATKGAVYYKDNDKFVKKESIDRDNQLPDTILCNDIEDKGLNIDPMFCSELNKTDENSLCLNDDDVLIPLAAGDMAAGLIVLTEYEKIEDKELLRKLFTILSSLLGPALLTANTLEQDNLIKNEPFRLLIEVIKDDFSRAAELDYPLSLVKFTVDAELPTGEEMHQLKDMVKEKISGITNMIGIYPGEVVVLVPGKDKKELRRMILMSDIDKTINNNPVKIKFSTFPEDGKDMYSILVKLRG